MSVLKDRILKEAMIIDESIIKVDHFINQQMDIELLRHIGEEFADYFSDKKVSKILTIEASGIAFAISTAFYLEDASVIYAKKGESKLSGDDYQAKVYSFTKKKSSTIRVNKQFLSGDDRVLIIDDFLASGSAIIGLLDIINQAKSEVVGVGIVIEKTFQQGRKILEERGIEVFSLVRVKSLADNSISLCSLL